MFGWKKRVELERLQIEKYRLEIEAARLRIETRQLELLEESTKRAATYAGSAQVSIKETVAQFVPILQALLTGNKPQAAALARGSVERITGGE
jgi:hypothetical protein